MTPLSGIFPLHTSTGRQSSASLPLVNARCHYDLIDVYALATLVQEYTSESLDSPQSVTYVFPLPPDAAVCAFRAEIDERMVHGVVKEKEMAKADFQWAVEQGKTAAFLEKRHADIFQISLGNLRPNQRISIHISFVIIVANDASSNQSTRLNIPVTIAPRDGTPPNLSSASSVFNVCSKLQVTVSVQMNGAIRSITSPTHTMSVGLGSIHAMDTGSSSDQSRDLCKAHVSFSSDDFLTDDIILVIHAAGLDAPRCIIDTGASGLPVATDALALTLVPCFDIPPLPKQDYIFLVDCSGNMEGSRINAVRASMHIALRSLPVSGTSFNIVRFGSRYTSLWENPVSYSSDNLRLATQHIEHLTADYGGTELGAALRAVYASVLLPEQKDIGRGGHTPTSVFVLTTGETWDLKGVTEIVQSSTIQSMDRGHLLRTFVVGLGNNVSTPICEGIARAGNGLAVFVSDKERPSSKLLGLLKAARGAVIGDLTIDWCEEADSSSPELVPSEPPSASQAGEIPVISMADGEISGPPSILPRIQQAPLLGTFPTALYPGFRFSVFALITRPSEPLSVSSSIRSTKLRGRVYGTDTLVESNVPVTPFQLSLSGISPTGPRHSQSDQPGPQSLLHILTARALIQSIESLPDANLGENVARVVGLGTRYSLASSQTSFVAIDEDASSSVYSFLDEEGVNEDVLTSTKKAQESVPAQTLIRVEDEAPPQIQSPEDYFTNPTSPSTSTTTAATTTSIPAATAAGGGVGPTHTTMGHHSAAALKWSGTAAPTPINIEPHAPANAALPGAEGFKPSGLAPSGACSNCKRLKMRCVIVAPDQCKRCRDGGKECLFEGRKQPSGRKMKKKDELLAEIREKDAVIEALLQELHNPTPQTSPGVSAQNLVPPVSSTLHEEHFNKGSLAYIEQPQVSVRGQTLVSGEDQAIYQSDTSAYLNQHTSGWESEGRYSNMDTDMNGSTSGAQIPRIDYDAYMHFISTDPGTGGGATPNPQQPLDAAHESAIHYFPGAGADPLGGLDGARSSWGLLPSLPFVNDPSYMTGIYSSGHDTIAPLETQSLEAYLSNPTFPSTSTTTATTAPSIRAATTRTEAGGGVGPTRTTTGHRSAAGIKRKLAAAPTSINVEPSAAAPLTTGGFKPSGLKPGACSNCKRLKMRCVPMTPDECKRCHDSGKECIVEGRKPRCAVNEKERLLAKIREKDTVIENLLKQLHNPPISFGVSAQSLASPVSSVPHKQRVNKDTLAWIEKAQASIPAQTLPHEKDRRDIRAYLDQDSSDSDSEGSHSDENNHMDGIGFEGPSHHDPESSLSRRRLKKRAGSSSPRLHSLPERFTPYTLLADLSINDLPHSPRSRSGPDVTSFPPAHGPSSDLVADTARHQDFDGSFPSSVLSILFPTPKSMSLNSVRLFSSSTAPAEPQFLVDAVKDHSVREIVWTTCLVLEFWRKKCGEDADVWELLAERALGYLRGVMKNVDICDESDLVKRWRELASAFIQ